MMATMETRLREAAVEGNAAMLSELLRQDPLLLDRLNFNGSIETPLHVAAVLGHRDFVREILKRKPDLVKELDSQRSSPLHLAAAKGFVEIVRDLVEVDADMCFVCDKDGLNPLHLAAMKGRVDVLKELIRVRPAAARSVMDDGGTILHLCVKSYQLEALRVLIEAIGDDSFLNVKDGYGFTILHLAVSTKQIKAVQYLVSDTGIEVNALNSNGFTALDVLTQSHRDLKDLDISETLRAAGSFQTTNMAASSSIKKAQRQPKTDANLLFSTPVSHTQISSSPTIDQQQISHIHENRSWFSRKEDALMVVALVIAIITFHAGTNPPGGFWPVRNPSYAPSYQAGKSIMADEEDDGSYFIYLMINTAGFMASLSVMFLVVAGLPFKHRVFFWIMRVSMLIAIASVALTYGIFVYFFTPEYARAIVFFIGMVGLVVVTFLILLPYLIQLLLHLLKKLRNSAQRERLPIC